MNVFTHEKIEIQKGDVDYDNWNQNSHLVKKSGH